MARLLRIAAGAAPLLLGLPFLSGCTDSYSDEMRYPLRVDPIFKNAPTTELKAPDRPGQLPVMSMQNVQDPTNPLYPLLEAETTRPLNPADLDPTDRAVLYAQLEAMFGTPANPTVEGPESEQIRKELGLETAKLKEGSVLYRRHCLHCHGLTGDGRGPTSFWINPHPRDYRQGIYKFISTNVAQGGAQRPRRDDLVRTVRQGIDGTAMPSFVALPEGEVDALVSYIILLGLRGEIEIDAMEKMIREKPGPGARSDWTPVEYIQQGLGVFGGRWLEAQKGIIEPDVYPYTTDEQFKQSVTRGKDVFARDEKEGGGGCIKCHVDYGRKSLFRYDAWGTMVRPPDLTQSIYRGGRRPVDLYWRVYAGINGSGMASFNNVLRPTDKEKAEKVDRLWDVVNFILVLPYPKMREQYGIEAN